MLSKRTHIDETQPPVRALFQKWASRWKEAEDRGAVVKGGHCLKVKFQKALALKPVCLSDWGHPSCCALIAWTSDLQTLQSKRSYSNIYPYLQIILGTQVHCEMWLTYFEFKKLQRGKNVNKGMELYIFSYTPKHTQLDIMESDIQAENKQN